MGVAAIKAHLTDALRRIESRGERVVIERRGRPVALLCPFDARAAEGAEEHWADALNGIAADVPDFDRVMRATMRSRRASRCRAVDLDR
jgi:antitoxin (DNA-binding transcriptional repressor) of toxin-antitoxin stability system